MTSLFLLWKATYPQSFMLIYGFLFELWVSNLNEEKEKKKKITNSAQYIYDGEDLGHPYIQSTIVLCDKKIIGMVQKETKQDKGSIAHLELLTVDCFTPYKSMI